MSSTSVSWRSATPCPCLRRWEAQIKSHNSAHFRGLIGPALRGEAPQARGEPGVQHIRLLPQRHPLPVLAGVRSCQD